MKIELTITQSKEDESMFTATASSGSFVKKKKLGTAITAEEIGNQISLIIKEINDEGLIGKK